MKKNIGAIFALGILAALPAHAQTAPGALALDRAGSSAAVKVHWDDYGWHNRWRSHYRWGSHGGWGWHSHYRWGSHGGWGWHNRWRSHYRWGSSYRGWWR